MLRAASPELLRNRFGKRYGRQIAAIRETNTRPPFAITTQDEQVVILALAGHVPSRAILVFNTFDPKPDSNSVRDCLQRVVTHCHEANVNDIRFRCCSKTFDELTVRSWLTDNWTEPDELQSYYRRNLVGVDERLERFVRDFADYSRLVPLSQLLSERALRNEILSSCSAKELRPTDDFVPEFSWAALNGRQVIGWLVVSRRRDKLLYNRLYVVPQHRDVMQLWGLRLVACAVAQQLRLEPETAIELHVREQDKRLANFYRRYLAAGCDRVESRWVSCYAQV